MPVIAGSGAYTEHSVNSGRAPLTLTAGPQASHMYIPTLLFHSLTFAGFAVGLQGESHGAAAAHPCGRVFTRPVAAAVVHGAGLCRWRDRGGNRKRRRGC